MHTNFADWYRMLSIDPSQVPLDLRWHGVEAAVKTISKSNAIDLVRLYFELPAKNSTYETVFCAAFREADSAFPMRDNKLEIEVLAATVIKSILDGTDFAISDSIALAISCADFQGLRPRPLLNEIIDEAHSYLHDRSDQLRSSLDAITISQLGKTTSLIPDVAKTQPEETITWSDMQPVLEKLDSVPNRLVKPMNDAISSLVDAINLQQEESNMLWWLFSKSSRDLRQNMSKLGKSACIVAGKELADLTSILPGPVAAEAFLDRILENSDGNHTVSVQEALSSDEIKDWKLKSTEHLNLDAYNDICSLHFAIRQSAETDTDAEWMPTFKKRAGISADQHIPSVALATQAYRERLLMKAIK